MQEKEEGTHSDGKEKTVISLIHFVTVQVLTRNSNDITQTTSTTGQN
jgi:hypothetical protein